MIVYSRRDLIDPYELKVHCLKTLRFKKVLDMANLFLINRTALELTKLFKEAGSFKNSDNVFDKSLGAFILTTVKDHNVATYYLRITDECPEATSECVCLYFNIYSIQALACSLKFVPLNIRAKEEEIRLISKWRLEMGK